MKTILMLGVVALAILLASSVQGEDYIAPPAPGYCGLTLPATYYGEVRTIGFEAQANSVLIARTEHFAWQAQPLTKKGYVVDVYQRLDGTPPCFSGGNLQFSIDGYQCWPSVQWQAGPHEVDLLCVNRGGQ